MLKAWSSTVADQTENLKTLTSYPELKEAVLKNNQHHLDVLLSKKNARAIINQMDEGGEQERGNTLLMMAVERGYVCIAQRLLSKGAWVNAEDQWGGTALDIAVVAQNLTLITLLVSYQAAYQLNGESLVTGNKPKMAKAKAKKPLIIDEAIRLAIEDGEALNQLQLSIPERRASAPFALGERRKSLVFFYQMKQKIWGQDIFEVAEEGNVNALSASLSAITDINALNKDGYTALMLATTHGHLAMVNALLKAGACPNVINKYNDTALSQALDSYNRCLEDPLEEHRNYAPTMLALARQLVSHGAECSVNNGKFEIGPLKGINFATKANQAIANAIEEGGVLYERKRSLFLS